MRKNKAKLFWILIGVGVLVVMSLIVVSNVINVGEKLRRIHPTVEIGFYIIACILIFILIINPLRIILFAPTFSIGTILDKDSHKTRSIEKRAARNLIRSNDVSDESRLTLTKAIKNDDGIREKIIEVYNKDIKKQLNAIILRNAKTVLVSTAISQNGKLDMLTVLVVNLKMIKEMVTKCGFRPSYAKLGKLSINVLTTALIAEGLEDLNFNELFPNASTGFLADIPLIKPIISSLMQGLSNGLLTLRIGLVTRKYLFEDAKLRTQRDIRRSAIKDSVMMMPLLIKESLLVFPERIRKMFKKERENKEEAI